MQHTTIITIQYDTEAQLLQALVDILSKANTEYDVDCKVSVTDAAGNKLRAYTVETYNEIYNPK